ncbi:unnamed protein product, partial [Amoebophrya sp. A25]|eukprot:GSA25T00006519001.1
MVGSSEQETSSIPSSPFEVEQSLFEHYRLKVVQLFEQWINQTIYGEAPGIETTSTTVTTTITAQQLKRQ